MPCLPLRHFPMLVKTMYNVHCTLYYGLAIYRAVIFINVTSVAENTDTLYIVKSSDMPLTIFPMSQNPEKILSSEMD